eukprot:TRINITY_DN11513_c1_g1_i1.p2 TRINITY_DN11513_c1_g1~~TRINITY_DN11513_c1_g1_i1.p2  ORF type:complete len:149 (-),score=14.45 TRINITY_DN11513_c1_g1_i1:129-575(-)
MLAGFDDRGLPRDLGDHRGRANGHVPHSEASELLFSDHIFLLVSMLAQLQTKLFVAVHAHQMNGETDLRPRAKACVVLGLFLVAGMCWEGFVTSRYYHTWEAVWLAWLVGTFIFGSFTFWWIGVVRYEEKKQEPLLPENPSNSFNNNA